MIKKNVSIKIMLLRQLMQQTFYGTFLGHPLVLEENWWSSLCTSYRWSHEALLLQCSTHCPFGKSEPLQSAAPYKLLTIRQHPRNCKRPNHQRIIITMYSISHFIHQKRLPFAPAISWPNVFFSTKWCWSLVFQVGINKNCCRMSKTIGVLFQ